MNLIEQTNPQGQRPWMRWVLWAAGLYNLTWGALVVLFPLAPFRWAGMPPPNYPEIWQCLGMVVGVYGVGYIIAAYNPLRHWPILLVGLMGKVFGPIGMAWSLLTGRLPLAAGWLCVVNDLIWWVPFSLMLHRAWVAEHGPHPRPAAQRAPGPAAGEGSDGRG